MPKVSSGIPNLLGGISQQDPVMRLPNQVSDILNMSLDAANGVRSRPGTYYEDALALSATTDNAKFHFVRRDESEKYLIGVTNTGVLFVYDLVNKVAKSVADNTSGAAATYLAYGSDPVNNIRMVSIADSTFIVNRSVTAAMTAAVSAGASAGALVQITRGLWNLEYSVTVTYDDNTSVTKSFSTGTPTDVYDSTTYHTGAIAANLQSALDGDTYISATILGDGDTLYITSSYSSPIKSVNVKDNFGGGASRSAYRVVDGRNELPSFGYPGLVLKVLETGGEQEYAYFVEWKETIAAGSTSYAGSGHWVECVGWNQATTFNQATLPLELKRLTGGTFSINQGAWESRPVGDDDSCPIPSFVGRTISDVFFHKNRIGFLAGENVIMSAASDLKNFWNESARSVYDTDPIDIAASSREVNNLRSAVPLQGSLLVVGENKQFWLTSNGALSPTTVSMDIATTHVVEDIIPAVVGSFAYLPVLKGDYSTLREYQVDSLTATSIAPDVTVQVDQLIEGEVVSMAASGAYNSLYLTTSVSNTRQPDIYVFQWFDNGKDRVQQSWARWSLGSDQKVYALTVFDKDVWLVVKRPGDAAGAYALLRMDLSFPLIGSIPYVPVLDYIRATPTIAYDSGTNRTTITLTDYKKSGEVPYLLFKSDFVSEGLKAGDNLSNITWNSTNTIGTVKGNLTGADLIWGYKVPIRIDFSTLFMREGNGGSGSILDGRLQLLEGRLAYTDSGDFSVLVDTSRKGGRVYSYDKGGLLGDTTFTYGSPYISSGVHRFAILSRNTDISISLVSDKFFPVTVQKLEWTGTFTLNSQRI